jgi:tetratricopeptide (TPR) repeat protein
MIAALMLAKRNVRLAALAITILSSSAALGQPGDKRQNQGRDLAIEALQLYQDEKYADALVKFEQAERLYPTGQVLRMHGFTLIALKRYVEAIDALNKALTTEFKPLMPADAEDTEDRLADIKKKVAQVTLRSDVTGATVRIDGGEPKPLPVTLPMNPGRHHLVVAAPERDTLDESHDIPSGASTLSFSPKKKKKPKEQDQKVEPLPRPGPTAPPAKTPTNLAGGWFAHQREVGVAIAGAGLAAGGVAIGVGIYGGSLQGAVQTNIDAHAQNYDSACSHNTQLCLHDIALINHDGERAAQARNLALLSGIVGAGLVVVGGTFVMFAPHGRVAPAPKDVKDKTSVACAATPDLAGMSLACRGSF